MKKEMRNIGIYTDINDEQVIVPIKTKPVVVEWDELAEDQTLELVGSTFLRTVSEAEKALFKVDPNLVFSNLKLIYWDSNSRSVYVQYTDLYAQGGLFDKIARSMKVDVVYRETLSNGKIYRNVDARPLWEVDGFIEELVSRIVEFGEIIKAGGYYGVVSTRFKAQWKGIDNRPLSKPNDKLHERIVKKYGL